LYRIEPNRTGGGAVQKTPYVREYLELLIKLSDEQRNELYSFIRMSLQNEKEFSIASKFGKASLAWHEVPLIYLYRLASEDEGKAAVLLGLMVMDVLIEDHREWLCIKTLMRGRDFPTNYYWLKAG
jgi:hypothetical protein